MTPSGPPGFPGLTVRTVGGDGISGLVPGLARLRIEVFRDFPYLYDGSLDYEERYLSGFAESPGAVVVAVEEQGRLVGAATGAPLAGHAAEFAAPLAAAGIDPTTCFYCAESVLLPAYRGRGLGHAFFDAREAQGRDLGFARSVFCAVIRPEDHPRRPVGYRPLDPFWRARGYAPQPGAVAHFAWRDIGTEAETEKPMQVWIRTL